MLFTISNLAREPKRDSNGVAIPGSSGYPFVYKNLLELYPTLETNHTIFKTDAGYEIEINTLNDLVKLTKEFGDLIINEMDIVIYDDYCE